MRFQTLFISKVEESSFESDHLWYFPDPSQEGKKQQRVVIGKIYQFKAFPFRKKKTDCRQRIGEQLNLRPDEFSRRLEIGPKTGTKRHSF